MIENYSNVLLTSSGRRNYLIDYFKNAANGKIKVFAADITSYAASLQEADKAFVVPAVSEPLYINNLLEICITNSVRIVIPLNDLELPVLAANREKFIENGIFPLVSSPDVINCCFNKFKTIEFLSSIQMSYPKTFLEPNESIRAVENGIMTFPLVVKPCYGSGSLGIYICYDNEELISAYNLLRKQLTRSPFGVYKNKIIIQEYLKCAEYGLDIVNDLEGKYVSTSVKRKLAMRAGETDKAIVEDIPALFALGEKISKNLNHIGNLDCDVFWDGINQPVVLEMNPRFGGGYPFSYQAGFDLPKAILCWINNEPVPDGCLKARPNIASSKCDRLVNIICK
jgi:carbamoyl-phosphate synthase large subunit